MKKRRYYLDQTDNGYLKPTFERILSLLQLNDGNRVLDLGCGAGYVGTYLPKRLGKIKLYGLDIDDVAKNNLRRGYQRVVIKDVEEKYKLSEFQSDYFDFIIAKDFFEHLLRPWKLIPELYRLLKSGGKIYAQVPHYTSGLAWIDYTHVRPFTRNSLEMMFKDYGFRVVRSQYFCLWILTNPLFSEVLANWPFFNRFAGNLEVIAQKP